MFNMALSFSTLLPDEVHGLFLSDYPVEVSTVRVSPII